MRGILSSAPLDLIDLLFYFEGFEVVKFGFVRLKFGVEFVLASFFLPLIRNAGRLHKHYILFRSFQTTQHARPYHQ